MIVANEVKKTNTHRFWIVLAIALGLSGCMKYKKQIATQQDEIAKLSLDLAESRQQKDDLERNGSDIEGTRAGLEAQIAEYESEQQCCRKSKTRATTSESTLLCKFRNHGTLSWPQLPPIFLVLPGEKNELERF